MTDSVQNIRSAGYLNGKPAIPSSFSASPAPTSFRRSRNPPRTAFDQGFDSQRHRHHHRSRPDDNHPRLGEGRRADADHLHLPGGGWWSFFFLRNPRATLIPAVAVPVSLIGTFAVMYLLGYSLDNLSLMALTISTGFVVDDAIVVMENISRHIENGMQPVCMPLFKGAKEIGFTVFSISVSLIAVFIPILLMGGIVGRLFREFAITLSTAIVVSMVISLTTTPTMCAHLLKPHEEQAWAPVPARATGFLPGCSSFYRRTLLWVLDNSGLTLTVLLLVIALNVVWRGDSQGLLPAAGHRELSSAACRGRRMPRSR